MPPFSARLRDPDPRVHPALPASSSAGDVRRGGAVVDQAELPVAEALAPDRADHRPEDVGRRVVDRRYDREAGRISHARRSGARAPGARSSPGRVTASFASRAKAISRSA